MRFRPLAAGLTLLRGFVSAGKPRLTGIGSRRSNAGTTSFASVILWIAQKVIAELGDPTACVETAKEKEPDRQKLAAFLEAAASIMQGKWRVADLIKQAGSLLDGASALHDALEEIAGERSTINPRILGRWIERHKDARCAGFYLERRGTRQRASLWKIRRYEQRDVHEPRWPENNSRNSQNSLSMIGDEPFAWLPTAAANDQPVAVTLRVAN